MENTQITLYDGVYFEVFTGKDLGAIWSNVNKKRRCVMVLESFFFYFVRKKTKNHLIDKLDTRYVWDVGIIKNEETNQYF